MNDDVLSSNTPKEPVKPIDSGPVYIGNSNTRGVVMQIHLQRFQQSLTANHAGLAAVSAWLALDGHHWLALLGSAMACMYSALLCRLWIDLIQDTVINLNFWNIQINGMVYKLGIKDYVRPEAEIERPVPKVQPNQLYRPLKQCTVAWVTLLMVSIYLFSQTEEVKPWTLMLLKALRPYLSSLC